MHKLDRIRLKEFKSIRETETCLHLLNILIGANGAGKSNFISAFRMLNQLVERQLQPFVGKAGGADALLHFGHKSTDRINVELHPYAIGLLADMLQSTATRTQIIVSTQSVPLVNQFTPEDLVVVDREEGQSVFRRLDGRELSG